MNGPSLIEISKKDRIQFALLSHLQIMVLLVVLALVIVASTMVGIEIFTVEARSALVAADLGTRGEVLDRILDKG